MLAAAVIGVGAGWVSGSVADRLASSRYAAGPLGGHHPGPPAQEPPVPPVAARARRGIAVIGALAAAALTASIGWGVALLPFVVVAWLGLTAAVVDLRHHRLPNVLTYGGAVASPALCLAAAHWYGMAGSFRGALVGSGAYAGFLVCQRAGSRVVSGTDGIGGGDVKLAVALGAPLGWYAWTSAPGGRGSLLLVLSAVTLAMLAGLCAVALRARSHGGRALPFGPCMVAGWLVAALLADTVVA